MKNPEDHQQESTDNNRENLVRLRSDIAEDIRLKSEPAEQKSRNRKAALRQAVRDITVQSIGTILGGSVLAGLAIIIGLLPSDALSLIVIAILSITLLVAVLSTIWSAINAPITKEDLLAIERIRALDEMINHLSETKDSPAEQGKQQPKHP
uniref:hypothetical protein n=1 Tax=Arthrobacter sp. TaxID=1667 RepID=UPI00159EC132|nr:hypothetical protein [Arthrobacter sp.]